MSETKKYYAFSRVCPDPYFQLPATEATAAVDLDPHGSSHVNVPLVRNDDSLGNLLIVLRNDCLEPILVELMVFVFEGKPDFGRRFPLDQDGNRARVWLNLKKENPASAGRVLRFGRADKAGVLAMSISSTETMAVCIDVKVSASDRKPEASS